ncbi:MAG TPA: DUF5916 domain-containing protein [Acidobacteriota bacterium]|nr:DUF5916 domain-containing protein [Acidobacteriota bacterium]
MLRPRPALEAVRVDDRPQLDGEVLAEEFWQAIEPAASEFFQTTPEEGAPSSQRTMVKVAYTDQTLFVGVMCFDDDPATIVVSDSRRDASLRETDSFQIIFDTYRDGQNGFVFGTNPAGIEYDGQVSREGSGGSASGGGFNLNWDGAWVVRTKMGPEGWSAEFAIPFTTLRYPSLQDQSWGLNFQRNIRRRNETAYWSPLSRQHDLFRLSDAGALTDLRIPSQRNLKVIPYVLGEMRKTGDQETLRLGDAGADAKYSITPALTLDLTYNTDFAQVEVDEQQINLNRFSLFFPEKRPFFLENAGLFAVGDPGNTELFFSRRIGLAQGREVPIVGGARLTGKVRGTNIGFLNMQTEEVGGLTQANNFTVARISRELPNRSSLGAIFVNRQGTGDLAPADDYNRTLGFDGRWGIGEYGSVSGFFAKTFDPDLTGDDHAFHLGTSYESQAWRLSFDYNEVAENFNPEVGFLRRGGFRSPSFLVFHTHRVKGNKWGLHEVRPHVSWEGFWDFEGFQETGFLHIDNHLEWKNGAEFHTGVNVTREGVKEPFEISDGVIVPPGTYDNSEVQLVANSNRGAWLSFDMRAVIGGFFSGDRVNLEPGMRMRLGERFITDLSWSRNDIELPQGDFVTNLARLRVSYSFTPRLHLQSLIQYNNVADVWSTNLRFSWLQAANTGLFIVYNDVRGFDSFRGQSPDRSLLIKFSRLFDVFN